MGYSEGEVTSEMEAAGRDALRCAMPGDSPAELAVAVYLAMRRVQTEGGFREWLGEKRAQDECGKVDVHSQPVVREMLDGSTFTEYPEAWPAGQDSDHVAAEPDLREISDKLSATVRRAAARAAMQQQRDEDVRMECLRLALHYHPVPSYTVGQIGTPPVLQKEPLDLAREIYAWVKGEDGDHA